MAGLKMDYAEVIQKLQSLKNPKNIEGMARFGIRPKSKVLGVPVPELRKLSKIIKKDHSLGLRLWDANIHEARILAGMILDPVKLTRTQIIKMAKSFDSWDVCDQACMNLFCKSKIAAGQIEIFAKSKEEFVKRTAFALIAALAVHDKISGDDYFLKFLALIKKASVDERNFVKKAVNWALRQIGKRNINLSKMALKAAREILAENLGGGAKWVANNAISELADVKIQERLKRKHEKV